jgi:hypothetical protein
MYNLSDHIKYVILTKIKFKVKKRINIYELRTWLSACRENNYLL